MIIYVIHQQRLFSMTLPLKISGSYTLTDIDSNNKERNLINISEQGQNFCDRCRTLLRSERINHGKGQAYPGQASGAGGRV